jgi:hypothetical protein
MSECIITDANNNLDNLLFQLLGIKKMKFMFYVVMQVEVQNVLLVMFVGKIEVQSKFLFSIINLINFCFFSPDFGYTR